MSQQISVKSKVDFKNGKIYIIRNRVNELTYIGSTCQSLSKRMVQHRSDNKNTQHDNMKLYILMKELGVDSFYIELVEYFSCNTREELYKREGECIRSQKSQLNNKIQGRTQEEYRKEEREKLLAGKKEHYQKNKEYYVQKATEYRETHVEQYNARARERYNKNKDKLQEQYKQKKDEINQKRRDKYAKRKPENDNFREELNNKYREWYAKNKEMKNELIQKEQETPEEGKYEIND